MRCVQSITTSVTAFGICVQSITTSVILSVSSVHQAHQTCHEAPMKRVVGRARSGVRGAVCVEVRKCLCVFRRGQLGQFSPLHRTIGATNHVMDGNRGACFGAPSDSESKLTTCRMPKCMETARNAECRQDESQQHVLRVPKITNALRRC